VSPPTNRSNKTAAAAGGLSVTPKSLSSSPQSTHLLSADVVASLSATVAALEQRVAATETRADDRQRLMEKEMAAMEARHAAEIAVVREKMLQVTAQLQYALHWINNFDAMAAVRREEDEEAFLGADAAGLHSSGVRRDHGAASRSGASGSVIRRLDFSTDSGAAFRMPPSPPMTLEQK
jgi:hypothetical protein